MKIPSFFFLAALFACSSAMPIARAQTTSKPPADANQPKQTTSVAEPGATSTSKLALPFKRAWQHLTDDAVTLAPTLDSAHIYLPLTGGRIYCLDRETGSLLWTSEPGGIISAPVASSENVVYIVTRRIAEDGTEAGGSLRAVDKATGLTVMGARLRAPFHIATRAFSGANLFRQRRWVVLRA